MTPDDLDDLDDLYECFVEKKKIKIYIIDLLDQKKASAVAALGAMIELCAEVHVLESTEIANINTFLDICREAYVETERVLAKMRSI